MAESQAKGAEVKSYNQLQGFPGMLSACLQETLSHQVSNLLLVVTSWPSHGFHGPVYTNVDLGVYRVTPRTIFYSPTWEADAMVPRANDLPTRKGFPFAWSVTGRLVLFGTPTTSKRRFRCIVRNTKDPDV